MRGARHLGTQIAFASSAAVLHPAPSDMEEVPLAAAIAEPMVGGATVRLVGLGKVFIGKTGRIEALRELNCPIRAGEFVTILGPSGCGKSTLLNLVAGLERPSTGWVEMDGERVDSPAADRIVVFQEGALFPWLDVQGNVEFGLRVAGVPTADRKARATECLEMVQLEKFARARIHELSGGMKQRVALARALVLRPRGLLMDEPFAALDAQTPEEMESGGQALCQPSGAATRFLQRDVREAAALGDRLAGPSLRPATCG